MKRNILRIPILRDVVGSSHDVERLLRPALAEVPQEVVVALHLNTRSRAVAAVIVSIGTLDVSIVHPRDVFREAIVRNARSVILVHTHPSGDPEPSLEDRVLTERLARAGELVGIPLVDHVILGQGHFSFAAAGML